MKSKINRIFYIYSEASLALFFFGCSLAEFLCFLAMPEGLRIIAGVGAIVFLLVAVINARYVYKQESK